MCRCLLLFPRPGLGYAQFFTTQELLGCHMGEWEASGRGMRKSGFDEPCFSGSVSFLYSEGIGLDSLNFPHQREDYV